MTTTNHPFQPRPARRHTPSLRRLAKLPHRPHRLLRQLPLLLLLLPLAACDTEGSCDYAGQTYPHGATFDADDDCNTCVCDDGAVSCTEIACEAADTDGSDS